MTETKKGKLIVIDGTDGSGKATQADLLVERIKKEGHDVLMTDFPQYGKKSAGLVENYLNGNYGGPNDVNPHAASMFYAVDRYDASAKMKKSLRDGKIIISNRYTTANIGHQGGKFKTEQERQEFFRWLFDLEYNLLGIPEPDINIILYVPTEVAQKLVDKKGHRDYIGGTKRDIHEDDLDHLKDACDSYLLAAKILPNFKLINCSTPDGNGIQTREEIHEKIWQTVKKII